jgi:hypothetical protein
MIIISTLKKSNLFLLLCLVVTAHVSVLANTDSLYIKGQIRNLNGRLYRQAPTITFSRNNIFQPQTVISKQVELNADGTFSTSLPLYFFQEEIYMDYGGKASAIFLGSKGDIYIEFDGDSLQDPKKVISFKGVNAMANNLYPHFLNFENNFFNSNPALGKNFYQKFWQMTPLEAQEITSKRAELRKSALAATEKAHRNDPVLASWIGSLIEEERVQNLYEFTLFNNYPIQQELLKSLNRISNAPLTSQRVSWVSRVGSYMDRQNEEFRFKNPTKTQSIPIRQTSQILKNNAEVISPEEIKVLDEIINRGTASPTQLDLLNTVFSKNELKMTPIFNFEREIRIYENLVGAEASIFLKALYFVKNFYHYDLQQIQQLQAHFQTFLALPQYVKSLNELVKLELNDSSNIKKFIENNPNETLPTEFVPGYKLTTSNDKGNTWLNKVLDMYKGKTIYLIKWDLENEKSREQLAYIPLLKSQLPANVEFVYVHFSFTDNPNGRDLAKKFTLRNQLQGTHLYLKQNQIMDLLFKLNPMDAGTYMILRPNGKTYAKNAPSPDQTELAIKAILETAGK